MSVVIVVARQHYLIIWKLLRRNIMENKLSNRLFNVSTSQHFGHGIGCGTLKLVGKIEDVSVRHDLVTNEIIVKVNGEVVYEYKTKTSDIAGTDSNTSRSQD
jgi:hypothetical protein